VKSYIAILAVVIFTSWWCPSADLTGDCFVDFEDFAVLAEQWLTTDPCVPADMVYIPDGSFLMGDSFSEGRAKERPVHSVTLDAFFMGKYEITNQQYCDFLNSALGQGLITVTSDIVYKSDSGTSYPYCDTYQSSTLSQINWNGSVFSVRTKGGRSMVNDPMVRVSWYGAAAYCNWRSQQEGKEQCYNLSTWGCNFSKNGYRLPTEAEWEYAARGGLSGTRFPWGDTISQTQANFYSSSSRSYDVSPVKNEYHTLWNNGIHPFTSPVGFFDGQMKYKTFYNWPSGLTNYQTTSGANAYGLYDMSGNVWEWCNDWYSDSYYSSSPSNNPTGPTSGTSRVKRGGSWGLDAWHCRVAYRDDSGPYSRNLTLGFRVVLSCFANCPSADVTGDCYVDFEDFALLAKQWLIKEPNTVWIDINDPGVSGHEPFNGQMNRYETTNAQYCQFLNAAIVSGDIIVDANYVIGANGSNTGTDFVGQIYYNLAGPGYTYNGAVNGGAARINYSGGVFTVDGGFENHPVTYVSWYGATAFASYYGWRLPTQWEWRAVADYDGTFTYGCGTGINTSIANYYNSVHPDGTTPVGAFGTYGYWMCDMAGNVAEWTNTGQTMSVLVGGGWYYFSQDCVVAYSHLGASLNETDHDIGFRVCR